MAKKITRVNVRLTESELKKLHDKAEAQGKTASELIRAFIKSN